MVGRMTEDTRAGEQCSKAAARPNILRRMIRRRFSLQDAVAPLDRDGSAGAPER
jgi:hypothetical protein